MQSSGARASWPRPGWPLVSTDSPTFWKDRLTAFPAQPYAVSSFPIGGKMKSLIVVLGLSLASAGANATGMVRRIIGCTSDGTHYEFDLKSLMTAPPGGPVTTHPPEMVFGTEVVSIEKDYKFVGSNGGFVLSGQLDGEPDSLLTASYNAGGAGPVVRVTLMRKGDTSPTEYVSPKVLCHH